MDLLLRAKGNQQPIEVVLVGGGAPVCFSVPWPDQVIQQHQAWRHRYLTYNDPTAAAVSADAVAMRGNALIAAMQSWFADPAWRPLDQQRQLQAKTTPLRISFEGSSTALQSLPWELLQWGQPIWRTEQQQHLVQRLPRSCHRPELLVWIGREHGLDLQQELQELKRLERGGEIRLQIHRGAEAGLGALKTALNDAGPWDALIFLGHSDGNAGDGGRLQLADGSWVAAQALQSDVQTAVERGLELVLLNSCSGLDLAKSLVRFGVAWSVCFREPVTCATASATFQRLIQQLKANKTLVMATDAVRQWLSSAGPPGSQLLLTVLASPHAGAYTLPLSKRRQFSLRVQATSRQQWLVAACACALGMGFDVVPTNPISRYLLDRRLHLQALHRNITQQPGPQASALPVLVIDQKTDQAVDGEPTPNRISRQTLARLLERTSASQVPSVALDVVLDEPLPNTDDLIAVLRRQQRERVLAGFFGAEVSAQGSGSTSMPLAPIQEAGVQAFDLATGMPTSQQDPKPAPLQLIESLGSSSFAGQIYPKDHSVMQADAVLDWSLDWSSMIQRVEPDELQGLTTPVLLIGSDGNVNQNAKDRFRAPAIPNLNLHAVWGGGKHEMPGVVLQAVLAQSLRMGHWLTPVSSALTAALASALGIALAAGIDRRWTRALLCGAITALAIPVCAQMAVSTLWLVPLLLPLTALWWVALVRRS